MFSFSKKKKIKSKVVAKKVKEGGNDVMEPAEVKEEGNDVEPPHEVDESDDLGQREIVHAAIVHKEVFKENAKNASQNIPGKDDISNNDRQRIFSENRKRNSFINSKRLSAENDIFVEDLE